MANARFIQDGNIINYKNAGTEAVAYNEVVALTDCIGVAVNEIRPGETGALRISGVHILPAAKTAMTVGQALYWDATNGQVTATATDNKKAGMAVEMKTTEADTCLVKLGG